VVLNALMHPGEKPGYVKIEYNKFSYEYSWERLSYLSNPALARLKKYRSWMCRDERSRLHLLKVDISVIRFPIDRDSLLKTSLAVGKPLDRSPEGIDS
jgi:hypothetical protein